MKNLIKIVLILNFFLLNEGCRSGNEKTKAEFLHRITQADSAKWLFFAYTYKSKALFKKNGKVYEFEPTTCEIDITNFNENDAIKIYRIVYKKSGFEYEHIYDGLMIYGFKYNKGVFIPLTGPVKIDGFDNLEVVRIDNGKTDSAFSSYLKSADKNKLSNWIIYESKRRNVF